MAWQQRGGKYGKKSGQGKKTYDRKKPAYKERTEEEQAPKVIHPGKITSIQSQKKNRNRISIFLDDKYAFGLHQDVLLQNNLYSGLDLNESDIKKLVDADALLRAKEASIVYLGHRARSEHEVRTKLKGKGFSEEIIAQVIKRLYELSYLNDEQFALNFTRNRFNHKGYGPKRIQADLRRLGIAGPLIERALDELLSENKVIDSALAEAEKRLRRLRRETDLTKKRKKLFDFLLRRGHTVDVVREVIDKLDLKADPGPVD